MLYELNVCNAKTTYHQSQGKMVAEKMDKEGQRVKSAVGFST